MGLFDRFTSKKGQDQTAGPKRGVVKGTKKRDDEKQAFSAVPSASTPTAAAKSKTTTAKTSGATKSVLAMSHVVQRVLLRPVVTEKSSRGGAHAQYTFEVAPSATKADVRQSVHHLYGVMPVAVNISNQAGKVVRFGRTYGRTMDRKKAIVTLPAGKTIDVLSA